MTRGHDPLYEDSCTWICIHVSVDVGEDETGARSMLSRSLSRLAPRLTGSALSLTLSRAA